MRVSKISIRNILGVEELEIAPGSLTALQGGNGVGKTSVIEGIASLLGGGHDATLLRRGAEVGEVVFLLEDGMEIRKRITAKGSTVAVTHPELGGLKGPQGYIDRLTNALAVNPVSFLTAPPKKRAEYLLEAMPLAVTVEDLEAAIGEPGLVGPIDPRWAEGHALEAIARVRREVYDERTAANRTAKDKAASAEQLSAGLPAEDDAPPAAAVALRQEKAALRDSLTRRLREIEQGRDAEVNALREEAQRRIDAIKEDARAKAEEIRATAEAAAREAEDAASPELDRLTGEEAAAEERERRAEQDAAARRLAAKLAQEGAEAEARAAALSRAVDGLDALKTRLLEQLPLKGVEIRDGEIYHDGIPFDRLNRAKQVQIAIGVARLRAGELALICVDGLECLDAATFRAFCERAGREDLQMIVTRVSEGPLQVESMSGAA